MSNKHYFLDGNTSKGYVSLINSLVETINKVYMIKGVLGKEKSIIFQTLGEKFESYGDIVYYFHNPSNEEKLDGIVIPKKSIAVIDGSERNRVEEKFANLLEEVIDLNQALDKVQVIINRNEIVQLHNEIEQYHETAYSMFAKGKEIHEKKEELYISAMDFEKANKVTAQLAANLFHDVKVSSEKPIIKQLFFGAATPKGAINYIDNITEDIQKRYIIKGRSGSGKSTVMRKIGKYAENVGLSVQYFPCGLDPNSLDMIIIPSLSVAILDGTAPHVIDPTRASDEVIDMFELCMDQSVEAIHGKQFDELHVAYKHKMKEGTLALQKAKKSILRLEELYEKAVDQEKLSAISERIIATITK